MKKLGPVLTKLTLGVALATAIVACNQNKQADKPAATVATGSSSTADKAEIVYINQDTLLKNYNYVKDMTGRLESHGKSAQADLQSRGQAFQREVAEYQKNAGTMSADARQATEQRLQRKNQELQAYQQNAGAQVQNEQMSEQAKLYEKISDFVKTYAKQKGYKMVLTYQKGNATVLYGDPSLDVTADVVKGLNDAYTKDKK
ncbi:OmpH family outer membrane protein [Mucilaginibacter sp. KACC 22063]|uniref:OmpH family outer membrane protein n=1 Tax=Mucilaginibacter sp. KACC 22063 TaxID=3025666 RepID=UPI002366691D|nr:OmpH family outer membrane protein [Mucilaginibacter sp. KACC 22063]WDF56783.1 OmpH family outer membrane protein [Mucilaginibacter sp. KACC 22063]